MAITVYTTANIECDRCGKRIAYASVDSSVASIIGAERSIINIECIECRNPKPEHSKPTPQNL